jgi:phage portal protein BeeE
MGLIARLRSDPTPKRRFNLSQLVEQVNYLGQNYPIGLQQTLGSRGDTEEPDSSFAGTVQAAYRAGGPVFSCILARAMLFSEARFQWQRLENGRPGALFGTPDLRLLEEPWPNGTTGELLWRAEQDVSLAGNFYARHHRNRLWRLRPDWVHILLGSQLDVDDPAEAIDAEVIGYLWGKPGNKKMTALLPEEVAHWSPIPDPLANYRGMSWITPIAREVGADHGAVVHRGRFFAEGATPNLVVMPDATVSYDEFKEWKDEFQDEHAGSWNAWKTLFLGGGSTVQVVGSSMKDMDYKAIMGVGETRIAAAAGVPPIVAGFSEGLESATYSNYGQARRKFGDHFARPQWRSFCAAIAKLLSRPSGPNRLWYDDRDIAFLREDSGDEAKIRQTDAITVRQLVEAGYEPDAAVAYVSSGQLSELTGKHSGLTSVQLTPPGAGGQEPADARTDESGDSGGGLEEVDGIDPVAAATLLQKLYLATPKKVVVSTEEARRLARNAGIDLDVEIPAELMPASVPADAQDDPPPADDD